MKKFLFVASMIFLLVAIVVYWFVGVWNGLAATVLLGLVIFTTNYLRKNNGRWWIALLIFIFSFSVLAGSFSAVTVRHMNRKIDIVIEENEIEENEIEEDLEEEEEVLVEYESETDVEEEKVSEEPTMEDNETLTLNKNTSDTPKIITKTEYIEKEVPIEKIVVKEVPVEKEVVKEVIVEKEVPVEKVVIKEIPVEKTPEVASTIAPVPPQPTVSQYKYNNAYYGDPTVMNNSYGYGYNSSISISGKKEVVAGREYTYTISGAVSITKSKLKLPSNVSIEKISGNKVTLYFDEGWTGTYSIGYGSSSIKVEVLSPN